MLTNKLIAARAGLAALVAAGTLATTLPAAQAEGTVNIYSYRQPFLIQPLLDAFTEKTGIETEVLFLDKGLEDRIAAEGSNSPADVILTVDIGRLMNAKEKGITQTVEDETVNSEIPSEFRDPEGHWFGVTTRGRVVYAPRTASSRTPSPMKSWPIPSGRARSACAAASTTTTSPCSPR